MKIEHILLDIRSLNQTYQPSRYNRHAYIYKSYLNPAQKITGGEQSEDQI